MVYLSAKACMGVAAFEKPHFVLVHAVQQTCSIAEVSHSQNVCNCSRGLSHSFAADYCPKDSVYIHGRCSVIVQDAAPYEIIVKDTEQRHVF
jgi:hypothetical protein